MCDAMPEQHDKLRATIRELEQELRSFETIDDETRTVLSEAVEEIRTALRKEEPSQFEPQSVVDPLSKAARDFEGSYPTLSGIINRLVDILGQMGI